MQISHACVVSECSAPVIAKGMCAKHYKRHQRHGATDQTRPTDWGAREKHPLYSLWVTLRRNRRKDMCAEWSDFWAFVADVKARPSSDVVLERINKSAQWGAGNVYWRKKYINTHDEHFRARRNEYAKNWRLANQRLEKDRDLRIAYGISIQDFELMLDFQGGVCAICRKPETAKSPRGGVRQLSVDHCHDTGKVRGLLCHHCNKALGGFKDSVETLKAAVAYLENASRSAF